VVLGECAFRFQSLTLFSSNTCLHVSGKLRRILLCSSNIGYPVRFAERNHRVRRYQCLAAILFDLAYSAILASYLLDEELGHLGRLGCTICILGSLIIVVHAPADKDIQTVDEILRYAVQPGASRSRSPHSAMRLNKWRAGFLLYCFCVLVFTLTMIYAIAPKFGRSNPLVYISICSLVGSVSIMAIKGFGIAVKLTLGGNNQFIYISTYVFGIVVSLCIIVQMNYFNKALDTFSTNVYVCYLSLFFAVSSLTLNYSG
jgi:hypothetical protein